VDPLYISLEGISEGENTSDGWRGPREQTLRVLMLHMFGLIHDVIHYSHRLTVIYCSSGSSSGGGCGGGGGYSSSSGGSSSSVVVRSFGTDSVIN
jgi:hypothetical protein